MRSVYLVGYSAVGLAGVFLTMSIAGSFSWSALSYYTLQSGLICLTVALVTLGCLLGHRQPEQTRHYSFWKFAALVAVSLTFLVFHVLLRPRITADYGVAYNPNTLPDIIVHTVIPVGFFLDYLLFDQKGRWRASYPVKGLFFPILYLGFTAIRVALGGSYRGMGATRNVPYFFLDVQTLGVRGVASWLGLIGLVVVSSGYVLLGLDRLLSKARARRLHREDPPASRLP